jgi:hypothetical protein
VKPKVKMVIQDSIILKDVVHYCCYCFWRTFLVGDLSLGYFPEENMKLPGYSIEYRFLKGGRDEDEQKKMIPFSLPC